MVNHLKSLFLKDKIVHKSKTEAKLFIRVFYDIFTQDCHAYIKDYQPIIFLYFHNIPI